MRGKKNEKELGKFSKWKRGKYNTLYIANLKEPLG